MVDFPYNKVGLEIVHLNDIKKPLLKLFFFDAYSVLPCDVLINIQTLEWLEKAIPAMKRKWQEEYDKNREYYSDSPLRIYGE